MYVIASRLKLAVVPVPGMPTKNPLNFGTPPKLHDSNYDAVQEACRLAGENPSKEYFVLKAVALASSKPPPVPPVEVKEL